MALRDFFLEQQTNQIVPSRLPGTAKGWDTSSVNREVRIDPSVNSDVEILPSMGVKLSGRAGQSLYVVPCAAKTDIPFGFVIYKAKSLNQNRTINRMMTVGRSMQFMDFVFKGAITAGQSVYQDPTDGYCTGNSDDGVYVGTAMETVKSTETFPVIATVEINIRVATSDTAESATDVSFNPAGLKVLTSQNVQGALGQTDSALADLQDSASILQTTVTLANTIGADTVVMLDELTAFEIDGRPNYKEPGATVYGPNGAQGIIHSVDAENQSATIKTTVLAAGGLASVSHDDTLTGDGTSESPLSVVGDGASLPDMTDNAGKFLTTDGATASWGDALVNSAKYPDYQIAIGGTTTGGSTGNIVIGNGSSSSEAFSIAIGRNCKVSAIGGILLSARGNSNLVINEYAELTDPYSFYVNIGDTSNGGMYKMLSQDGTIPAARHAALPAEEGTYTLKATVAADGTVTTSWVKDA